MKEPRKSKTRRRCIQLDAAYYKKLQMTKEKTGQPIVEILRRAIDKIK